MAEELPSTNIQSFDPLQEPFGQLLIIVLLIFGIE